VCGGSTSPSTLEIAERSLACGVGGGHYHYAMRNDVNSWSELARRLHGEPILIQKVAFIVEWTLFFVQPLKFIEHGDLIACVERVAKHDIVSDAWIIKFAYAEFLWHSEHGRIKRDDRALWQVVILLDLFVEEYDFILAEVCARLREIGSDKLCEVHGFILSEDKKNRVESDFSTLTKEFAERSLACGVGGGLMSQRCLSSLLFEEVHCLLCPQVGNIERE
jgi:hypothetical protein